MAVTGLALTATNPIVESPVNDDFSYAKTALHLAETGQLVYNGWAAAMLGAQAYWGALFVDVFGASFFSLRLSTMVLAVWSAGLLYSLHRRAQLPAGLAIFGTLALTLSPLFIPNAGTFMTDVPALFFFLLSIYGCVRQAEILEKTTAGGPDGNVGVPARAWMWVGFVLVTGILGGTIRQTNFIIPALGPGLIFWLSRDRIRPTPGLFLALAFSVLFPVLAAIGLTAWYHAQPFAIHERLGEGVRRFLKFDVEQHVVGLLKIGLTFAAAILPLMSIFPSIWRGTLGGKANDSRGWMIALACLIPVGCFWLPELQVEGKRWYFPWMGNTFGSRVYLTGGVPRPPGDFPLTLPLWVFKGLSVVVLGLLSGSVAYLLVNRSWRRLAGIRAWTIWESPALVIWVAFTALYLPLLILKFFMPYSNGIWDRYLLPVIPLASIWTLKVVQAGGRGRIPFGPWLLLLIFAGYGVAQSHDYFSQLRARLAVTDHLERLGIERQRIMGGFEYDGWTQISVAGFYNDLRIVNPSGVYQVSPPSLGFKTIYLMWRFTPVVKPDYVLVLNSHADLFDTDLPVQDYECWLPPFRGRVAVQVRDRALSRTSVMADPPR